MCKKFSIYFSAAIPIVAVLLMLNQLGGGFRPIINFAGAALFVYWISNITKEKMKNVSEYVKQRILYEGLHALSISLIAGLLVVFFIQPDAFQAHFQIFLAIIIFASGLLAISEAKLGIYRSRKK